MKLNQTLEPFKTPAFSLIESAINALGIFLKGPDLQFDIESSEGQFACKGFLKCLEELNRDFECRPADRAYRQSFSKAYKVLYAEDQLCYLTEILDSAQEGLISSGADALC